MKKDGTMKLLIAFAAVLSSAALTVPTVTDITQSTADVRELASLAAHGSDDKNA